MVNEKLLPAKKQSKLLVRINRQTKEEDVRLVNTNGKSNTWTIRNISPLWGKFESDLKYQKGTNGITGIQDLSQRTFGLTA